MQQRFEALFGKKTSVIKPGLERIRRAYEALNRPGKNIPTILVAGTNGKGTTCAFLWKILSAQGLRVGLYTSPHLQRFSERFVVSGQKIRDDDVHREWERLITALPSELYDELSFFEVATLIAFRLFDQARVDVIILEVGLGGRFDATNISEPDISVITGIALDHQAYLGGTLEAIAYEKCGVMRLGRPVVVGHASSLRSNASVMAVIESEALRMGAHLMAFVDRSAVYVSDAGGIPEHLLSNFSLAEDVAALHCSLQHIVYTPLPVSSGAQVLTELACVRGRYERLCVEPARDSGYSGTLRNLILDVAHNPDGVRALQRRIEKEFPHQCLPAFVSILGDKDVAEMLDILERMFDPIVLFKIQNERSFQLKDLPARHQHLTYFSSFAEAWQEGLGAWNKDLPWVICGSIAAVGEVFAFFSVDLSDEDSGCRGRGFNPIARST